MEKLAATLTTIHNLTWYASFMARMRQSIVDGTFESYRQWVHEIYPEKTEGPSKGDARRSSGKNVKKRRRRTRFRGSRMGFDLPLKSPSPPPLAYTAMQN